MKTNIRLSRMAEIDFYINCPCQEVEFFGMFDGDDLKSGEVKEKRKCPKYGAIYVVTAKIELKAERVKE